MRLLLINPKFPESFWSFKWASDHITPDIRTTNPPLGLATVAALCPPEWEVSIVDENIESVPLHPEADIIGVCGMGVQFPRQKELLTFYRNQGYFVVAGGSFASLCPEHYTDIADVVISGEAEYIWREFCRDLMQGKARRLYQETGEVSLADSPAPRFDLLKLPKYRSVSLQFSRGCPFRCEFCDIIVMFGRKPRTKSPQQIGLELDKLRQLDVHNAFFVDDNLIGNKPLAKDLLGYLAEYQQQHNYRFHFGTEASLNMAQDQELMELFHKAGFEWVFIGIESPDTESLKETKKLQNTREDIITSIRKIYANGLDIFAGFIVGFDNDTPAIFQKQFRFIMESGIQAAMIGLLTALPKTPLYERLEKEGRLITEQDNADNVKMVTNVLPKQMSYDQLISGYRELYRRLLQPRHIAGRIANKIRFLSRPVYDGNFPLSEKLQILKNLFLKGLLQAGPSGIYHFLRSIPLTRPRLIPIVMQDWIIGLAMRDYVARNFIREFDYVNQKAQRYLRRLEIVFRKQLNRGALELSLNQVKNAAAHLSISLKGKVQRGFYRRAAAQLETMLEDTASSITLHIEVLQESHRKQFQRLLKRLQRYGDRIYIRINEQIKPLVEIDSSVFNLVLEIPAPQSVNQ